MGFYAGFGPVSRHSSAHLAQVCSAHLAQVCSAHLAQVCSAHLAQVYKNMEIE